MFANVIVGTDGSKTAARAVDRAVEVAKVAGATLTIVSVGDVELAGRAVASEAARHEASGLDIATKVLSGQPAVALVEEAETGGYDLLVVGNKGMTGPSRFLLGSVPNKVSHHAPCALLIVRTT